MKKFALALIMTITTLPLAVAVPGAPALLSYQGQLTNAAGNPVTVPTGVRFTLLWGGTATENPSTGRTVYQEEATVIPDGSGVFLHLIGAGSPGSACDESRDGTPNEPCVLTPADFPDAATAVFLELRFDPAGNNNLLLPRQRVASVGYALNADTVDGQEGARVADTLDTAYDRGGPGQGRTITADAGAVNVAGTGGLTVAGNTGIGTTMPAGVLHSHSSNVADENVILSADGLSDTFQMRASNNGADDVLVISNDLDDNQGITIQGNGQVGIGTASGLDSFALTVAGETRFRNKITLPEPLPGSNNNEQITLWNGYKIFSDNVGAGTANTRLRLDGPDEGEIKVGPNAGASFLGHLEFRSNSVRFDTETGGNNSLRIISNGNVGIGVSAPAYALDVAGTVHASSCSCSSDARLKEDIRPLEDVLSKVGRIRGVSFEWNETGRALGRTTGDRQIGLIAQDVKAVFPGLVTSGGEEGYLSIDYGRLSAVLVEAIKAQQAAIESQQAQIDELRRLLREDMD